MYSYLIGIITEINPSYIVLENNNIGYKINVANPYFFKEGIEYKIYLYEHIREDEHSLYGFNKIEERDLFLKLINVKGLGPKMALPILATGSISGIIDAINRENILYLKKFPKIGDKVAKQIILDLKGKMEASSELYIDDSTEELIEVLENLGYKRNEIKKIIPNIDKSKPIESQVKEALKLLSK